MAETSNREKARELLFQFKGGYIDQDPCNTGLVALGAVNDPDMSGSAYSAQQATTNVLAGTSVPTVLGLLNL